MATFTASTPRAFVRNPRPSPQLKGQEGQALDKKIAEVKDSIQNLESFGRLIQALEDENKKRQEELRVYIDSLRCEAESTLESELSASVADVSWQTWQRLSLHFFEQGLCLEVPDACPGQNNNFMYTWSKTEHYLECEIFDTGAVEFFYRNRKTGEVWGEDTTLEHGFSTAVFEKTALFAW